jgi:hypothetical protein
LRDSRGATHLGIDENRPDIRCGRLCFWRLPMCLLWLNYSLDLRFVKPVVDCPCLKALLQMNPYEVGDAPFSSAQRHVHFAAPGQAANALAEVWPPG